MRARFLYLPLLVAALALPALAQKEFLNDNEINEIREAQEPDKRLKLYVDFAKARLDAVAKLIAADTPDRGEAIHNNLYEYDRILHAIDLNADQAEKRRDLFRKGLEYALDQEPGFLKQLEAVQAGNPRDLDDYKFVLDQAIGNTRDSIEGLGELLGKQPKGRKEEKTYKDEGEKQREKNVRVPPPREIGPTKPTWDPSVGPPRRKRP